MDEGGGRGMYRDAGGLKQGPCSPGSAEVRKRDKE